MAWAGVVWDGSKALAGKLEEQNRLFFHYVILTERRLTTIENHVGLPVRPGPVRPGPSFEEFMKKQSGRDWRRWLNQTRVVAPRVPLQAWGA